MAVVGTDPLNPGKPTPVSSYTAAQLLDVAQQDRVAANERIPLGLAAPPAGTTNADMAALAGYATAEQLPTRF